MIITRFGQLKTQDDLPGTLGYLTVNGEIVCNTLELGVDENGKKNLRRDTSRTRLTRLATALKAGNITSTQLAGLGTYMTVPSGEADRRVLADSVLTWAKKPGSQPKGAMAAALKLDNGRISNGIHILGASVTGLKNMGLLSIDRSKGLYLVTCERSLPEWYRDAMRVLDDPNFVPVIQGLSPNTKLSINTSSGKKDFTITRDMVRQAFLATTPYYGGNIPVDVRLDETNEVKTIRVDAVILGWALKAGVTGNTNCTVTLHGKGEQSVENMDRDGRLSEMFDRLTHDGVRCDVDLLQQDGSGGSLSAGGNRNGIFFHTGNNPSNSSGCILLGDFVFEKDGIKDQHAVVTPFANVTNATFKSFAKGDQRWNEISAKVGDEFFDSDGQPAKNLPLLLVHELGMNPDELRDDLPQLMSIHESRVADDADILKTITNRWYLGDLSVNARLDARDVAPVTATPSFDAVQY